MPGSVIHVYHESAEYLAQLVRRSAPGREVVPLSTREALAAALPEGALLAGYSLGARLALDAALRGTVRLCGTLLIGGLATHAASPHLLKADYDPLKDFEPVGMIGSAPIIAITFNESPYKTLKDVVDAARKDPKGVMYGSSGNGSPLHLAGELFTSQNKIDMTHVPYKGGNAHIMDLIGGRVPVIFDTATNCVPLLKSGKVRALAVGAPARLPDFPNVPTFAEAGYPQFDFSAWYAVFAPAKTPKDVVAKLNAAVATMLSSQEFVDQQLVPQGMSAMNMTPPQFGAHIKSETDRMTRIVQLSGAKVD